jgi:hypothetical protein
VTRPLPSLILPLKWRQEYSYRLRNRSLLSYSEVSTSHALVVGVHAVLYYSAPCSTRTEVSPLEVSPLLTLSPSLERGGSGVKKKEGEVGEGGGWGRGGG